MGLTGKALRPSKNLDGVVGKRPLTAEHKLTGHSLVTLLCLEEVLGWSYNAVLTGVSLKRKKDGWQLVVKIVRRNQPLVSFTHAAKPREALLHLIDQTGKGRIEWHVDDYPVRY